jgi:hypothetical protein
MSNAKECARNSNIPIKATYGLCEKFMKRESLSLWRRMKISQKLPLEYVTKLSEFQCLAIVLCQRNKYSLKKKKKNHSGILSINTVMPGWIKIIIYWHLVAK